jgi:Cu/Ag efflux protein CusF
MKELHRTGLALFATLLFGHREAGMIGTPLPSSDSPQTQHGRKTIMNNKFTVAVLAIILAVSSGAAMAQNAMVKGEVKKIDETAGKITLKHGPIKSLGMDDEMTMVFRVQDPAMLKQVKVGDKVKFEVERATAGITVTKMQKGK